MIKKSSATNKPLDGKRIGILGKGGSGKSTAAALLAKALRARGYDLCVLDADSTNVGLHQALGLGKPPVSLIDYFGGTVFSGGAVTCPVDDPMLLARSEISLDEIPDDYYSRNREGIFFLVAGKIGDKGPGAGCDGPISKITRDLKIKKSGKALLTLIDIKAGLEDPARGVITSLDQAVVVVDPSTASIQVAADIKNVVARIKSGELPATRHLDKPELVEMANRIFLNAKIKSVLVILNKIKNKETESYLRAKLKKEGIEPAGTIRQDGSISLSWLRGEPIDAVKAGKDAEKLVERLEELTLS